MLPLLKRLTITILCLLICVGSLAFPQGFRKMDRISDAEGIISESQVWSIDSRGGDKAAVYFGTTEGLFKYDGMRLLHCPSPQVQTLRAVRYDKERGCLYTAGASGFGWWDNDEFGRSVYHQLSASNSSSLNQDFWRICIPGDGYIYFQSYEEICIYSPENGQITNIPPKTSFRYMFAPNGEVLVQDGGVLCRITPEHKLEEICRVQGRIMNIVSCGEKTIAALERAGLMELDTNGSLKPLDAESNRILSSSKILSMSLYDDAHLLVGTTLGGFFVTDVNGRILHGPDPAWQLGNATVLSVEHDSNGDVWLGMEAGIARIDYRSQNLYLSDQKLGRVRGIVQLRDGRLLVGSNKGVFINSGREFRLVPGSTGSVWNLAQIEGVPYVAHDQGLFRLDHNLNLIPVYKERGVLSVAQSTTNPDYFLCGTYDGLALFQKEKNSLEYVSIIRNYGGFCRYLHFDDAGRLWIRDRRKGFIRLCLDYETCSVTERKDFDLFEKDGDNLFIIELGEILLFCRNHQTWCINEETGDLERDTKGDDLLLQFERKYGTIENYRNGAGPFPVNNGYASGLLNGVRFCSGAEIPAQSLYISGVEMVGSDKRAPCSLSGGRVQIPFYMNSISIRVAGNTGDKEVEYNISPDSQEWKSVPASGQINISALKFGNHDISVRLQYYPEIVAAYRVNICRPWYLTGWMFGAYALLLTGFIIGIREYYRRKTRKAREQAQLKADLKAKSKELANITFNSARRNSQLNEIKALLTTADPIRRPREVEKVTRQGIAMIDGFLADENDWEKSEEYFNIIYDGLLEKLKKAYPEISKTDMKICVYTKLNLSTKEIADILNVSVRSIEMARYRLRKRLGLPAGQDIAEMLKDITG